MKEEAPLFERFSNYEILVAAKIEACDMGKRYIRMEPKRIYLDQEIDLENLNV